MRMLGNILWHIPFLGFINAICAWLIGLLLTLTVVGAPIGTGLMAYGRFLFAPFGQTMVSKGDLGLAQNPLWQTYSFIIRVLYFPIGLVLAIFAAFQVVGLLLSIVGIPVALVVAKSIGTYFNPVGKVCVSSEVADEVARRAAADYVSRQRGES